MSPQSQKAGISSTRWLAIIVVIVAVIIVGITIYKYFEPIIYALTFLLIIIPLFLNRKWVSSILVWIRGTYKKHTALGVLVTIGAVAAFLPFSAFLVLKTIWEFLISKNGKNNSKKQSAIGEDFEIGASEIDEMSDRDNDFTSKNIDSKFPPTDQ